MRIFIVRFGLVLCTLGLLTFGGERAVRALALTQPISPETFWERVEQTLTTLRDLRSKPEETVNLALDKLAGEWSQVDALTVPDPDNAGKTLTIPIDTSSIVSQLRKRPYNISQLINRFNGLQEARKHSPTRSFDQAELDALKEILKNPDFQWDQPPSPLEDFWNQLWNRINEWLNQVFNSDDGVRVPIPGEAFSIGASVILAIVLLFVFRSLFGDFLLDAAAKDEQVAGDELLTAESALQKAKDISRGGDYRTAVRYLYISSLLTLDERGLMRFDRSKTNREYLRSVAAYPQLSAPLRDVIDVFDRVWYGFQPLDADSFQHYAEKVDQLREQKR